MPAASQHREHGGLARPEELDRNRPVHSLSCSNKRALIAAAHSHRDIHVLSVELVQPLRGVRGRSWLEDRELGDANQMIRLAEAAGIALAADTTIPPDRSSRGPRIRTPPSGILVPCGGRSMRQSDTRHGHEHEGRLRTIDLENGLRPEDVTAAAKPLE
jgi:hypothetical protein